ncbi:hypothetical protein IFM89_004087 [Coptis chinensis]|uniref:Uncharacterized protein n=1 Tax=Coptis chinensis TaxID=261450 RepID=A0A835MBP1_9MAGN|nr:hypothetical protein IFM89_004087 [Coptis chinensis]
MRYSIPMVLYISPSLGLIQLFLSFSVFIMRRLKNKELFDPRIIKERRSNTPPIPKQSEGLQGRTCYGSASLSLLASFSGILRSGVRLRLLDSGDIGSQEQSAEKGEINEWGNLTHEKDWLKKERDGFEVDGISLREEVSSLKFKLHEAEDLHKAA